MANISHFLKKAWLADFKLSGKTDFHLITAILLVITIQAGYAVSNFALALFVVASVAGFKKARLKNNIWQLLLPVGLFGLMCLSLLWSIDTSKTLKALSKNLPLLLTPCCIIMQPLSRRKAGIVLKYYSFAMIGFAAWYMLRAVVRYMQLGNSSVFFYHELTTFDVNAVHVSLYMAVALFYFLSRPVMKATNYAAVAFLGLLIILLSSKSLIIVTVILAGIYFLFFSAYTKRLKTIITLGGIVSAICFIMLVPKIRERFLLETRTMFTENTVSESIGNESAKVYNVSLREALTQTTFSHNDFIPGTALRAFQARIFFEMAGEDNAWFTGYGLNAAQGKIKDKVNKYNLHPGYGEFNFHNQYIQNMAELGIAGLLILLAMLYVNVKNAYQRKDFVHISLAILLITLFLTESLLARQRGIMFFAAFYCFLNAVNARDGETQTL